MNTHETYVSLEVAKLLKQAGFNWDCDSFYGLDVRYRGKSIDENEEYELKAKGEGSKIEYVDGGMVYNFYHTNKECEDYGGYSRPTLAVAQKWLREVKSREVFVECISGEKKYKCYYTHGLVNMATSNFYSTYEDALEVGIKKVLELILEKGE